MSWFVVTHDEPLSGIRGTLKQGSPWFLLVIILILIILADEGKYPV